MKIAPIYGWDFYFGAGWMIYGIDNVYIKQARVIKKVLGDRCKSICDRLGKCIIGIEALSDSPCNAPEFSQDDKNLILLTQTMLPELLPPEIFNEF
jgi:hypothetical protein